MGPRPARAHAAQRCGNAAGSDSGAATDGPAEFRDGPAVSYGFGWFLDPYRGHKRMSHDGETIGFRTTIQRFPENQLTIIVLSNRADVNPEELALKVADLYLGSK